MNSRILAGTPAAIELTVYEDGEPVAFGGTPTVTVVHQATGATIVEDAEATIGETGTLRYTLSPAITATVKPLRATWSATVGSAAMTWDTYHEIVGAHLFTIAEARAFDMAALGSAEAYPDELITAYRDLVAESFEDVTGVSFGTRYRRDVLDGDGTTVLWLRRVQCSRVVGVSIRTRGSQTWTALDDLDGLVLSEHGHLERESGGVWPAGRQNIAVEYEHGWQPIPAEVSRAALWLARDNLTGTDLPRNAIAQNDQFGTFTLSTPGLRGSYYGLPQVDEVVKRYSRRIPGVA